MTLELRLAISPTPAFFNRVRLIAQSVREFYPDAQVTVVVSPEVQAVSPEVDIGCLAPNPPLPVAWRFVPREEFQRWKHSRYPYIATAARRFAPPFSGDHILVLDADVLCIRRFDELFQLPGISGMMAHVAPMRAIDWACLFQGFGLSTPWEWHEHSAFGIMDRREEMRHSPPYFNSGMVFGAREEVERIWEAYQDALDYLRRAVPDQYWFDQLGLALALAKAGVRTNPLPMRWNFANQASFDEAFPEELADVRFLHFMRTDTIDRDRDFASDAALAKLLHRRDLTGSNEILRARIAELMVTA